MEEIYSIPLSDLCKEFSLEVVFAPPNFDSIMITNPEISRPGLGRLILHITALRWYP